MKTKTAKYPPRKLERARIEWAKQWTHCMVCRHQVIHEPAGYSTLAAHVHHICNRSQSTIWEHLANVIVACENCHMRIVHGSGGNWHRALLACKLIADPGNYDLEVFLRIVGKADQTPPYITKWEVLAAVEALELTARITTEEANLAKR